MMFSSFGDFVRRATLDQLVRVIISLKLRYYPPLDLVKPYMLRRPFLIIRINDLIFVTPITHAIYQPHICEPVTYNFFQTILFRNPDFYFLDVGAAIGSYTIPAAKKGWHVIAVEPDPLAYSALVLNAKLNTVSIETIKGAVYNRRGKVKIGEFYVKTVVLDDLNERFDLIKIDCDGCERQAVEGGLETLRRARYIIVEERTETFEYVHTHLKALGKRVLMVEPLCSKSLSGIFLKPRVKSCDFNVVYTS